MRVPYRYAAPWFGYWSYMSERCTTRWRRMSDEVEARTYGSDKAISDTLQFWSDATIGWCAALRGGVAADLPRVFFLLEPTAQSASKEIDFFAPGHPHGTPEVAYLRPVLGGDSKQIDETKCTVCPVPRRHGLVIHLDGLRQKDDPPLTAGVYQGLIHIGDEPVALLDVKVAGAIPRQCAAGS